MPIQGGQGTRKILKVTAEIEMSDRKITEPQLKAAAELIMGYTADCAQEVLGDDRIAQVRVNWTYEYRWLQAGAIVASDGTIMTAGVDTPAEAASV